MNRGSSILRHGWKHFISKLNNKTTFTENLVSYYIEKPPMVHWNAVKRIFNYPVNGLNYSLIYDS